MENRHPIIPMLTGSIMPLAHYTVCESTVYITENQFIDGHIPGNVFGILHAMSVIRNVTMPAFLNAEDKQEAAITAERVCQLQNIILINMDKINRELDEGIVKGNKEYRFECVDVGVVLIMK